MVLVRTPRLTVREHQPIRLLGGVNAIAMVVDRFSNAIVETRSCRTPLGGNGMGRARCRLKFMRTLWLCQQAGGPFQYTGKALGEARRDLHITSEAFDEVEAEIAHALDHLNVPERENGGGLGGHRREEG